LPQTNNSHPKIRHFYPANVGIIPDTDSLQNVFSLLQKQEDELSKDLHDITVMCFFGFRTGEPTHIPVIAGNPS
jgi:hypothetical protein